MADEPPPTTTTPAADVEQPPPAPAGGAPATSPDGATYVEYSTRFYLSPTRVAALSVLASFPYHVWWIWRLFHHVKYERLPRPHSFWTMLVPLYNLKTLSDQFRTVHEESVKATGRSPFALQGAYILWITALVVDRFTGLTRGPIVAVFLLISSALFGLVAYWVQKAANSYLKARVAGHAEHGMSVGEVIAVVLGSLLTLLVFVGAFFAR